MNYSNREWKGLCELYGEQNLIEAERVENAKMRAFYNCSECESEVRLSHFNGKFFSEKEDEQIKHFAKQGVKVRLK